MSELKRLSKWDNLKFILILLVVIGHFLSSRANYGDIANRLVLIIYTFHIPLFIFVSGLFSKSSINNGRLKTERVGFFIVLYIALAALNYVVKLLFGEYEAIGLLGTYHVQWYMLAMAGFLLIMYALRHVNPALVMGTAILLSCFAGYDTQIGNFLCLSKIISFFPFFAAGYYFEPAALAELARRRSVKAGAVLVLAVFIAVVWLFPQWYSDSMRPLLFVSVSGMYSRLPNPYFGVVYRLIYYAVAALVSMSIIALVPERKTFFSSAGRRTLSIYFYHVPLLMIFFSSGLNVWLRDNLPLPPTLILIMVAVLVTAVLSIPIFEKSLSFIMKLPPRKLPGESTKEK